MHNTQGNNVSVIFVHSSIDSNSDFKYIFLFLPDELAGL